MLKPHFHASPDLFIQILTKPVKKKKTPSRNVSTDSSRSVSTYSSMYTCNDTPSRKVSSDISKHVRIDTTQNEEHIYEQGSYEVKSTRV